MGITESQVLLIAFVVAMVGLLLTLEIGMRRVRGRR
jgi:hypothetical protein